MRYTHCGSFEIVPECNIQKITKEVRRYMPVNVFWSPVGEDIAEFKKKNVRIPVVDKKGVRQMIAGYYKAIVVEWGGNTA